MSTVRVFGWRCPGLGADDDTLTWQYRIWFWLYRTNQQARHRLGIHERPNGYSISPRCDWCGYRNPGQRAIALRNWRAMDEPATRPPSRRDDHRETADEGAVA